MRPLRVFWRLRQFKIDTWYDGGLWDFMPISNRGRQFLYDLRNQLNRA